MMLVNVNVTSLKQQHRCVLGGVYLDRECWESECVLAAPDVRWGWPLAPNLQSLWKGIDHRS